MRKDLKEIVKEKYTAVVENKESSCCQPSCCSPDTGVDTFFNEDYSHLEGYVADADLALGCGIPLEHTKIEEGMTVLDLGSGAGNDVFVAARQVGISGKVIGLDFTEAMVKKAMANQEKLGIENVSFVFGDIEDMPLPSNSVDLVISNCVLNLVPDKKSAFAEMNRVLRANGRFAISDIVLTGDLDPTLRDAAALYAGCVSGALQKDEYLAIVQEAGFKNISVAKERRIELTDEFLQQHLDDQTIADFRESGTGIVSITLTGTV